jgi:hypothetical protein
MPRFSFSSSFSSVIAAEGVEPSSLDYRSSALPIVLHRDGRPGGTQTRTSRLKRPLLCRSSSGSKMAVAEGLEPSITGLTVRRLTNLATPQENWLREQESNLRYLAYETNEQPLLYSRNVWMRRRELNSHQLVYKTSALVQLSYAARIWWTGRELNPHEKFAGLLCCQLHHQPETLEARGGVEPRAFPPSSSEVRFRRPMPGTRAAGGRGVRPTRLFELHDLRQSPFCGDESRPEMIGTQGRIQTFNLWFVGPALHRLSYSGLNWWSELDSNQPIGLFRPALIHLSYPTERVFATDERGLRG